MAGTKEPWSDTIGRVVWNVTAPVTDDGGGIIKGTGIKAGQEVIYSKIIRKILKADNKSWMHLVLFSLVTAAFDEGLGAWWGDHKFPDDQGVLKEFPRPVLSCLAVNYVFASTSLGIHNAQEHRLQGATHHAGGQGRGRGWKRRFVQECRCHTGRDRKMGQLPGTTTERLSVEEDVKNPGCIINTS